MNIQFANGADDLTRRVACSFVGWVKSNPLKVSGITWGVGEWFSGRAGILNLHNPLMAVAAGFGAASCVIDIIWGRGGEGDGDGLSEPLDLLQKPAAKTFDISLRKSLQFWRYPVEAGAFLGMLNGTNYGIAGAVEWYRHGTPDATALYLLGTEATFLVGSIYANAVASRPGSMHPMVTSSLWYGAGTALMAFTAISVGSVQLWEAVACFSVSCVAWGVSHRHDNKRRPAPPAPEL